MREFPRREHLLLSAASALVVADWALRPALSDAQWQAAEMTLELAVAALLAWHRRRQEMTPLYAALLAAACAHILPGHARLLLAAQAAGIVLAWAATLLFPWPDFSDLLGDFQTIGCVSARLGGVECRVFYPSARRPPADRAAGARYLHHGEHLMRGMSVFTKLPAWLFHNMRNAVLAAIEGAPVAAGNWPIVLFSHGLGGSLEMYSHVNQQLASSGLVVVVLNHCDGSASVASPADGQVEYYRQISREVRDNIDGAGFRFRNAQLRQRVRELRAVLTDLLDRKRHAVTAKTGTAAVTLDDVLFTVDAANVSAVGHSFGAATALTAAHEDDRIARAVLLDAWMEPVDEAARDGLGDRVPVLHLLSEHFFHWRDNFESTQQHARGNTHAQSRLAVLHGSRHNNFSDIPVFSPRVNRWMKSAGTIDPFYALRATGQLSAAFLRGSFAVRAAQFPEVESVSA
jgi:platelet-activating factor acetylhydrolase